MQDKIRGTLSKYRDKWRIIITYYDNDGNRKQKTYSTDLSCSGNKRKAEALLKEKLKEFEEQYSGYANPSGDVSVSEWVEHYLDSIESEIKPTTAYNYRRTYNNYIKPYFENIKLKDLTSKDVDVYYKKLTTILSNGSIQNVVSIFKNSIKFAMRLEIIDKNPTQYVKKYKSDTMIKKQNKRVYDLEELYKMLDEIKEEPTYPLILFTVFYGLRRGEIAGLTWDCIDFDNRTITVKQNKIWIKEEGFKLVDYCKTKKSVRTLTITDETYNLLQQIKDTQKFYKTKRAYKYVGDKYDYVFSHCNGTGFTPGGIYDMYINTLKRHNIDLTRFHDLRHTTATLMFEQGADVTTVQHSLGHSKATTTMNIYIHSTDNNNSKAANIMNEIIKL